MGLPAVVREYLESEGIRASVRRTGLSNWSAPGQGWLDRIAPLCKFFGIGENDYERLIGTLVSGGPEGCRALLDVAAQELEPTLGAAGVASVRHALIPLFQAAIEHGVCSFRPELITVSSSDQKRRIALWVDAKLDERIRAAAFAQNESLSDIGARAITNELSVIEATHGPLPTRLRSVR